MWLNLQTPSLSIQLQWDILKTCSYCDWGDKPFPSFLTYNPGLCQELSFLFINSTIIIQCLVLSSLFPEVQAVYN